MDSEPLIFLGLQGFEHLVEPAEHRLEPVELRAEPVEFQGPDCSCLYFELAVELSQEFVELAVESLELPQ